MTDLEKFLNSDSGRKFNIQMFSKFYRVLRVKNVGFCVRFRDNEGDTWTNDPKVYGKDDILNFLGF